MSKRLVTLFSRIIVCICSAFLLLGMYFMHSSLTVKAQGTTPFLASPYYGAVIENQGYSAGHPAYDYAVNYSQVLSADSGVVERVRWYNNDPACHGPVTNSVCGYGLHVYITHSNGYVSRYAHLSSATYRINTSGQSVQAGQIIGTSGNTGWSTGPHLHFEVVNGSGTSVNPSSPNLWEDGQWAPYYRPIPAPASAEITVIENTADNSAGFRKGTGGFEVSSCTGNCGTWTQASGGSSSTFYYTAADRVNNSADQWAKWTLANVPDGGGIYEIYVHVPSTNATSWQVPYVISSRDINNNSVTTYATIDQFGLTDDWVSIGTYRMSSGDYIYMHDATGEAQNGHCTGSCQMAADAVRFVRRGTVYLPGYRFSSPPNSHMILRNNGAGPANIRAKCYNNNGGLLVAFNFALNAHERITANCSSTQIAHATIEASQDVSVILRTLNLNEDRRILDNGFMPAGFGDPAFEQVASTTYVPAFYHANFGVSSRLILFNPTGSWANVTVEFKDRNNVNNTSNLYGLAPRGGGTVNSNAIFNAAWGGSLRITSDQPLAVHLEEDASNNIGRSFNATAVGKTLLYVPAAYRQYFGLSTGLVVQNLGNVATNARLTICDHQFVTCHTHMFNNLPALQARGIYLDDPTVTPVLANWRGSVKIESLNNDNSVNTNAPLAVVANNGKLFSTGNGGGYDFSAAGSGGRNIYLPVANKSTTGYTTGYTIRNISTGAVTGTAIYYNANGTVIGTQPFTLGVGQVVGYHQANDTFLPNNWEGSVMISASNNVVAIMREDTTTSLSGYNGLVR
jgi:hypothetical protein